MITTSPMELVNIIVLKDKAEKTARGLIDLGVFHPVDIRDIEKELKRIAPMDIEEEREEWEMLDADLKDILKKTKIALPKRVKAEMSDSNSIKQNIDFIKRKMEPLIKKKEELQRDLEMKASMLPQIKEHAGVPLEKTGFYTYLEVFVGKLDEGNVKALLRSLADIPHVFYTFEKSGRKVTAMVIGLKMDKESIQRALCDMAWEEVVYPKGHEALPKDAVDQIMAEIEKKKNDIKQIDEEINKIGSDSAAVLSRDQASIALKRVLFKARKLSSVTKMTAVISGWIPEEEREKVLSEARANPDIMYVEIKTAGETQISKDEIPVRLKHGAFLKPFEMLINNYGIPRYGSIDPTVFAAFSFLFMFGAMFGDLGQGAVMAVASLFLMRIKKTAIKQAALLILYCSLSSCVFGILYGSFFGIEFELHLIENIKGTTELFRMSIVFGVVLITAGILINAINALRDRDYLKLLFDKTGLLSGVIYWSAIGYISRMLAAKGDIPPIFLILICGGLVILFLKPIMELIFKKLHRGLFISFTESLIDLLEVVMGYLANTVSFIRVAAFTLAHAGLFFAVFEIARMMRGTAGGAFSLLTIIIGNIFIILLEGMVVGIQSLRLNYYEFFSKFFMTGKRTYEPLRV